MLPVALSFLHFHFLFGLFQRNYKTSIAHNFLSLNHSAVSILLSLYHINISPIPHIIVCYSCAYYLYDLTLYKFEAKNTTYILHHITSIYFISSILRRHLDVNLIVKGFMVCEITNQPMYLVYHKIQKGEYIPKKLLFIEGIFYAIIRPLYGLYIIYEAELMMTVISSLIFGIMSIVWGYGVLHKIN